MYAVSGHWSTINYVIHIELTHFNRNINTRVTVIVYMHHPCKYRINYIGKHKLCHIKDVI